MKRHPSHSWRCFCTLHVLRKLALILCSYFGNLFNVAARMEAGILMVASCVSLVPLMQGPLGTCWNASTRTNRPRNGHWSHHDGAFLYSIHEHAWLQDHRHPLQAQNGCISGSHPARADRQAHRTPHGIPAPLDLFRHVWRINLHECREIVCWRDGMLINMHRHIIGRHA